VEISFFYWGFLPCYCEIQNLVRERKKEKRKQENKGGFCTSSLFFWCSLASKYTPVSSTLLDLAEFLVGTPRLGFSELMAIELAA